MIDPIFVTCGECEGCKAKAQIVKIVADVDEVFMPRLMAAVERYRSLPYHDEHEERDARRQVDALMEERSRWISYITKPLIALAGCYRLVITIPGNAA